MASAPEQVVTAPGTSGANFLAFAALVEPGDEVLVERPTYEPLLAALGFLGARVRRFERRFENGYRLDLDEIRSQLTDGVRLVVLANPHNPSGVLLPPEEVAAGGAARRRAPAPISWSTRSTATSGSRRRRPATSISAPTSSPPAA